MCKLDPANQSLDYRTPDEMYFGAHDSELAVAA
jgi:hypothetical protein